MDKEKIVRNAEKIRNTAFSLAKKSASAAKENGIKLKEDYDTKKLQPAFVNEFKEAELPKIIRITEADKKHINNPVCEGSIGYYMHANGMKALNLFNDCFGELDVEFYPSVEQDVYYVDPHNPKKYISLNEYFMYSKKARIEELNRIAQDLGAKHFKVSIKTEKKVFVEKKAQIKGGKAKVINADANVKVDKTTAERVEVASESRFKGHAPKKPELVYFATESEIKSLIEMRMKGDNPIESQTILLQYNNSSGIKKDVAMKIDSLLKKMKLGGNASVLEEVKEESRMTFEYLIEFENCESQHN